MIVLNGTSSSGKTSIVACLQALLPSPFLAFSVDTFVAALPPEADASAPTDTVPIDTAPIDTVRSVEARHGIAFGADGQVSVDARFRRLELAWYQGLAAIAAAGVGVILDEVFLGGAASQARLGGAMRAQTVLWVGVTCDLAVAEARETARADRVAGMAASQVDRVHAGVDYDLIVDTTATSALDCARLIAAAWERT